MVGQDLHYCVNVFSMRSNEERVCDTMLQAHEGRGTLVISA